MKKVIAVLMSAVMVMMCLAGCKKEENSAPVAPEDFRITSYIIADRIQDIKNLHTEDFDIITDVILIGSVRFDENGAVNDNAEVTKTALDNLRAVIGDRTVKIYITVLGPSAQTESEDWYEQMDDLASRHTNAFKCEALASDFARLVNDYGFDGLFFDYEYPIAKKHWKSFSKFLVELKGELGEKELGAALSNWDLNLSKEAMAAVDRVEMMLYDMYDSEGRHSTYEHSVELSADFIKHGYDKSTLDFGLPFYARPTDQDAFWYDYAGYYDKLDADNMAQIPENGKTAYFNTPEIIKKKTAYALENGFGGVMIWHYNCDLPSSDSHSLLKAIGEAKQEKIQAKG